MVPPLTILSWPSPSWPSPMIRSLVLVSVALAEAPLTMLVTALLRLRIPLPPNVAPVAATVRVDVAVQRPGKGDRAGYGYRRAIDNHQRGRESGASQGVAPTGEANRSGAGDRAGERVPGSSEIDPVACGDADRAARLSPHVGDREGRCSKAGCSATLADLGDGQRRSGSDVGGPAGEAQGSGSGEGAKQVEGLANADGSTRPCQGETSAPSDFHRCEVVKSGRRQKAGNRHVVPHQQAGEHARSRAQLQSPAVARHLTCEHRSGLHDQRGGGRFAGDGLAARA